MKKLLKKAGQLASAIDAEYMKLDMETDFSNNMHDTMLIQKDCAWQEVGEMEHYTKKEHLEKTIEALEKTLAYCKAVINAQEVVNKIPEAIFG